MIPYMKFFFLILISSLSISCASNYSTIKDGKQTPSNQQVQSEYLNPIRPGIPEQQAFWNHYSKQFMYAPAFDFKIVDKAIEYEFIATDINSKEYKFKSDKPWSPLSPIWNELPVGYIDLEVFGVEFNGKRIKHSGTRKFYKSAGFNGPYNIKVMDYGESARKALKYLFNKTHFQNWLINASPDTNYKFYCYPSKIIGAVIESMILYSQNSPDDSLRAIEIAKNAANYLISISEPENSPLAHFPPTYMWNVLSAKDYKDQFMLIYPADVAINYLNLYDITSNKKYFNAALKIVDTYKRLQLSSGTWKLKLWKDGTAVKENECIPVNIIELIERLSTQYKIDDYKNSAIEAFNWIMDNPVKTFDWSGQFEDIDPGIQYKNLSKHDACSFAIYLLKKENPPEEYKALAEELLRFSEDQFVVWKKPMPHIYPRAQNWILPCALEQYDYYVPIDASVSKLMETYLTAYKVIGKEVYYLKAVEFANAMTVAQIEETGRYPTYWERNERRDVNEGWINCATYDAKVMLKMKALNK